VYVICLQMDKFGRNLLPVFGKHAIAIVTLYKVKQK